MRAIWYQHTTKRGVPRGGRGHDLLALLQEFHRKATPGDQVRRSDGVVLVQRCSAYYLDDLKRIEAENWGLTHDD